jgi:hypothetical protein
MTQDDAIQLTIKSVPAATRDKMNKLAKKRGQTLGYWLTEVVEKAQMDELLPPLDRASDEMPRAATAPLTMVDLQNAMTAAAATAPQPQPLAQPPVPFTMVDLQNAMTAAVAVSEKSGVPMQKKTAQLAFAVLNRQLQLGKKLLDEALGHFHEPGQQVMVLPPNRGR